MEPQIQAWQEEEVEEDTVSLRRNSRQHNSNYSSNVTPNGGNEANGAEETEKTQENGAEEAEKTQKNEAEQTEETEEAEKTQENVAEEAEQTEENEHSNSVYFETHQGTGSGHGVSGMEDNATESSASKADSSDGGLDLKRNKFEIQRIPSTEIIRECTKSSANEILFGLSPVTAQKLHDQNIKNLKDLQNSAEEDAEDDLLELTDNELTDLDVERVLQEQTTHDLYCPNCNSCITRRVVLCRKRPRVRKIPRTPKPRNKLETRELNFNLPYEAGQGPKKVDVSLNESPTPASDHNNDGQLNVSPNGTHTVRAVDHNNVGQLNVSPNDNPTGPVTEIFRCLSCFSFFIPTGNGSKLFQCLGGSGDNPNTQDVQNRPTPTENWWLKIFGNKKTSIDDGDVIIDIRPQTPHPVESKPLQTQPVETHPVETHPVEMLPVQTQPLQLQPVHTLPVQTQPVHTQPMNTVEPRNWDILKSIVYGGLVESITSLGVVSSAAGAGATTLNILALGLASMVGGLLIIAHNVRELKNDQFQMNEQEDRYQRVLGQRRNFSRHVIVVFLSFIIFGLVAPVVYGFSFRKSDDRDLKIAAVAGSSLACIVLLAAAKAHIQNGSYLKTVLYYVSLGITASGISYVVGDLFDKLMEKLGLFTSSTEALIPFLETDLMNTNMMKAAWSS